MTRTRNCCLLRWQPIRSRLSRRRSNVALCCPRCQCRHDNDGRPGARASNLKTQALPGVTVRLGGRRPGGGPVTELSTRGRYRIRVDAASRSATSEMKSDYCPVIKIRVIVAGASDPTLSRPGQSGWHAAGHRPGPGSGHGMPEPACQRRRYCSSRCLVDKLGHPSTRSGPCHVLNYRDWSSR